MPRRNRRDRYEFRLAESLVLPGTDITGAQVNAFIEAGEGYDRRPERADHRPQRGQRSTNESINEPTNEPVDDSNVVSIRHRTRRTP